MRILAPLKKGTREKPGILTAQQQGAATLVMSMMLIAVSTLIIIFAANYGIMQSKSISNLVRHEQAYQAAEAGLEFGINYLQRNNATILANPVSGYIQPYSDSNITNVTLANNSVFNITYSNPVANNYNLIKISSTGTSDDGSATRVISQLVQFGSLLLNKPPIPLQSKGRVNLYDSSDVTNTSSNSTIKSGSTVALFGGSSTVLASGTSSTNGNILSDIAMNDSALAATSSSDIFASNFGISKSVARSSIGTYYSANSTSDYSNRLNGLRGTSIMIDQQGGYAIIAGSAVIGSSTSPVVLIITGTPYIGGNAVIYGFVFVDNLLTTYIADDALIVGGVVATGPFRIQNTAHVMYSNTVLNNLQNQSSMRYFAKIPGTWKDF